MNICFYISDYGYGHASRDIAIIRKILDEYKNIKIYIKTDGAFDFVKQSLLQSNVEVIRTKNDVGVVLKENSVVVDRERTRRVLDDWQDSWKDYINEEKRFCEIHKINLILSDIVPQVFIVADELNIPGIAISNFTWHYIFYNLFGDIPAIERIKDAYQRADLALILPFNEDMDLFREKKEVSLVSREITADRYDMRKELDIQDNELLVYIGVGRSLDPSFTHMMKKIDIPGLKLLIASNVELPFDSVIRIPDTETETQNYINMCDLVVSKTGYSTISEAMRAEIPMFLFKRDGFKEDELIGDMIERSGIGRSISERSFLEGGWKHELHYVHNHKRNFDAIDGRYKKDGTLEIIDIIKEMVS
ncbi:MAG: hypothetical protein SCH70_12920 [Candidatus Methanoperedens sp.]|nr:hypothetical protein [Candidatus Methanoperedens sp.]